MSVQDKTFIHWDVIYADCDQLYQRIQASGRKIHTIVAITRGGMVPAGILSQMLGVKKIDTIGISSYEDARRGTLGLIKTLHPSTVVDEGCLFVDELVDSGQTIRLIKEWFPKSLAVALYSKVDDSPIDMFIDMFDSDTWIVFPWESN